MKEHIKWFNSVNAADNFIIEEPFICCIGTIGQPPEYILRCDEPNKKISVVGGVPTVVDN